MKKGTILLVFIPLIFWGCPEVEQVSPIPEVHFLSMKFGQVYDSALGQIFNAGTLEFSFIDGDADLGVYDDVNSNTSLPDSVKYGIFINFFEKIDGNYIERFNVQETDTIPELDTIPFNQLFPYDEKLDRVGQNKTIKGVVRIVILFPLSLQYDTMRFEFYIRDRALHKSNVEYTSDFAITDLNQN
jgi:hypothetical protein